MAFENYSNNTASTLTAPLDNVTNPVTVNIASGAGFPNAGQFRVLIDNEILLVTAGGGTTSMTATRAQEGTPIASHSTGAAVYQILTAVGLLNKDNFDVRSYSAKGDGVTDDSTAVQAAITAAASAGGGTVWFPIGTYLIGTTLTISGDNINLAGVGWGSVIRAKSGLNADLIKTPTTSGSSRKYCVIRDLQLDGNKAGQTAGHVVHFYGAQYCKIEKCLIINAFDHAVSLDGDGGAGFGFNNTIFDNVFDVNNGVITDSNNEANFILNNQFKFAATGNMLNMTSGGHFINGNVFGGSGTYSVPALLLANGLSSKVIGNRFDHTRHQGIKCNAGNQIIIGNEFFDCVTATSNTESVIHIGANNNNMVVGNNIRTDASATWQYAIHQDNPSDKNIIVGNQITAGLTGTIQTDVGNTGSNIWRYNVGFDPAGFQSVAYSATITPDVSLGGVISVGALTAGITVGTPVNPSIGQLLTFLFTQDATGGRAVTWNGVFKTAFQPVQAANAISSVTFFYDGTNWQQLAPAATDASGNVLVTGAINMNTAASQLVPGATSFAVRDNANANNNLLISNAGAVTVRSGLTVSASGLTVTGSPDITLTDAASTIVPGATSFAIRDNGNANNNLLVNNNGTVTTRSGLTVTAGGLTVTAGASSFAPGILSPGTSHPTSSSFASNVNSATVAGNDTRGTVVIVTGAGTQVAVNTTVCVISFINNTLYGSTPVIVLQNMTAGAASTTAHSGSWGVVSASATGFSIVVLGAALTNSGSFTIGYWVIG